MRTCAQKMWRVPSGAAARGDLSPPGWRVERLRGEKLARLKRRALVVAGAYVGLLALWVLALAGLKLRLTWLESRLAAVQPASNAVQAGDLRWKHLGPAIDPSTYAIETLLQVYECLPPGDVIRLTSYNASLAGQPSLGILGEAPSAAIAVEFTEKLKVQPGLRKFHLKASPPAILPNGHASFRVEGNL